MLHSTGQSSPVRRNSRPLRTRHGPSRWTTQWHRSPPSSLHSRALRDVPSLALLHFDHPLKHRRLGKPVGSEASEEAAEDAAEEVKKEMLKEVAAEAAEEAMEDI